MKRLAFMFSFLLLIVGCGGGSTAPAGNNNPPGGSVKVFTATINGAPFTGATVVGAYLGGNLTVNAHNGQGRSISINAQGVNAGSPFNLNVGNQWSALAQMVDATLGTFSTGYLGGSGTVTLTTATLSRITGTFSLIAYTGAGTGLGSAVITVQNGTFDISNP
jgi:hypothetical protein